MVSPDLLVSVANVGLAIVVIPTVWHGFTHKVCSIPLRTSVGRVAFLSLMGAGFASAGMVDSAVTVVFNIAMWSTLAAQNLMYARQTVNSKPHTDKE